MRPLVDPTRRSSGEAADDTNINIHLVWGAGIAGPSGVATDRMAARPSASRFTIETAAARNAKADCAATPVRLVFSARDWEHARRSSSSPAAAGSFAGRRTGRAVVGGSVPPPFP
jgi:hypothetical protein